MTKAALIAKVAAQMQLSKKQTDVIIALFFTSITDALSEGDNVELRGFGSFRVRHRPPRKGRFRRHASRTGRSMCSALERPISCFGLKVR